MSPPRAVAAAGRAPVGAAPAAHRWSAQPPSRRAGKGSGRGLGVAAALALPEEPVSPSEGSHGPASAPAPGQWAPRLPWSPLAERFLGGSKGATAEAVSASGGKDGGRGEAATASTAAAEAETPEETMPAAAGWRPSLRSCTAPVVVPRLALRADDSWRKDRFADAEGAGTRKGAGAGTASATVAALVTHRRWAPKSSRQAMPAPPDVAGGGGGAGRGGGGKGGRQRRNSGGGRPADGPPASLTEELPSTHRRGSGGGKSTEGKTGAPEGPAAIAAARIFAYEQKRRGGDLNSRSGTARSDATAGVVDAVARGGAAVVEKRSCPGESGGPQCFNLAEDDLDEEEADFFPQMEGNEEEASSEVLRGA